MKKLVILFTLLAILVCALSITSICFADDEIVASEEAVIEAQETSTDFNFGLWLKDVLSRAKTWIIGGGIGVTLGGIFATIIYAIAKFLVNKTLNTLTDKVNSTTIADKTSEKLLDNISNIALDVNVKPLMEYHYKQISAQVYDDLNKQNELIKKMILENTICLEKLGGYFDNSVAVSDEQKDEFYKSIENLKALAYEPSNEIEAQIEVVAEAPKDTSKKVAENY